MTRIELAEIEQLLARTPATLRSLLAGIPPAALEYREAPGTWNAVEVLCHLADGEIEDWIPRAQIILSGTDDLRFQPFDREGGFRRYAGWSASALLDEFDARRRASLKALDAFYITDEQLAWNGIHPEFGLVTLEQLLATWATHDLAHVAQISRVLTRYFGRHVGPWSKSFSLLRDAATA